MAGTTGTSRRPSRAIFDARFEHELQLWPTGPGIVAVNGPLAAWPAASGEMASLIRAFDWAATPLGPSRHWPQSLKTVLNLMLPAQAEMVVFWGDDFRAFYNDAYAPTIGAKHPAALGMPAAEHWTELWHDLEPLLTRVQSTGETFSAKDRPFQINRHGHLEQVYFDISYSALRDEAGAVAGVLCIVAETTARVLAARAQAAAQAALQQQQDFTRLLLDSSSEGFYAVDREGVTTTCNAAFLRMLGYACEAEVLGRRLHDEIHHSHADGSHYGVLACPIYECARTGKPAHVQGEVFFARNGRSFPVDYRVDPIWRNGELQGALCTFADSSERLLGQALKKSQQQTESELRETHDQLRLAEAAVGIGLFLIDIKADRVTGSAEFFRLFGLPPVRTLPAGDIEALVQRDDRSAPSSQATRSTGEAALNVEYRIRRADTGELRWISRRAEFVRDGAGQPVWMRGIVQDVTDRKLAEATLKASESRFRVLAQAIPNQVWTAAPDGRLDWMNQKIYQDSGWPEEDLMGDGWIRLVHPDDLARVSAQWQSSLQTGQPYETEFRILHRDGSYHWHLVRALPIVSGNETRWLGTNTDIDDQKALQQALAELNITLEQRVAERTRDRDRMWRLSTDLIVIGEVGGVVTAVNPAWEKLLGWTEPELIGTTLAQLIHDDDQASTAAAIEKVTAGQSIHGFENRYRHRDGSYRVISWIAVPDAGLVHAVGRDITAEREAGQALKDASDRLRQSQKMEALGQLTGGIAHDFNNLLQGISGAIDVVRRRLAAGRTDDLERFMDSAGNSAHRAAALVHRLLAFARRQSLDSKRVDVNALVMSMEELLRRTLGEHIGLKVAVGQGVWAARSDENQLESAILNLAINARDAMPAGGSLSLETRNATLDESYTGLYDGLEPGDYAMLLVTDTGTGMSPEVLARVFEPFFTTKPIGQGTGLGLSMIYGFAKQSGGHVRIYSQVGQGTSVSLFLPRHADEASAATDAVAPAAPSQAEGETVLVVEDDAAVRLIVLDELNERGYHTLEAADGLAAIPILQSTQKIDLLITDVGLPGMNGRQVAEIGRQHRPGLRVIFMTGYAQNAAVRSEFLAPGMEMISKPFAMDDLAARIREMLSDEAATQPPFQASKSN